MPSSSFVYSPLRFLQPQKLTPPRAGLIHRLAANHPFRTTPSPPSPVPSLYQPTSHRGVTMPRDAEAFSSHVLSRPHFLFLCTLRLQCCHQQSFVGDIRISASTEACRACRLKLCTARWMGARSGEADILFLSYRSSLLRNQCVALLIFVAVDHQNCLGDSRSVVR